MNPLTKWHNVTKQTKPNDQPTNQLTLLKLNPKVNTTNNKVRTWSQSSQYQFTHDPLEHYLLSPSS
jgi:hypothetical protein